MIEHAGLLAYLWFTIGNLEILWNMTIVVLIVLLVTWYLFNIISTGGISWLSINKDGIKETSIYKEELTDAIRNRSKLFLLTKIFIFMMLINIIVPSRNQMLIIFSAKPLIKSGINISNNIADSNTTKSIGIILNNSLKYLEKKSKNLNK